LKRIAVLGAGPAGGAAALTLARAGAEVDLYYPAKAGEKPCGGAVPEHVLPRLAGFDPSPLPVVAGPEALVENASGARIALDLGTIRIFRRADFDKHLADSATAAGAKPIAAKVEALAWEESEIRITAGGATRAYDWVIGADGARGRSRRSLGLEPRGESVGLGASLSGVSWKRLCLGLPDLADGYTWIFPRPGGVSVGIAYSPERLSDGAAHAALDSYLDRHLPEGWRDFPGPRYRYPIPVFGPWTLESVRQGLARRILLTGDAAAVADPLTREGIRYGMLSGIWAAESLLAGTPEAYPERLAAELEGEMERAALARSLFFDDPIGQWMVPVSRAHPGIRRVLADLLACRQPYRGLRRRLVRAAISLPRPSPPRTRTPSAPAP
jgi:menaquinone-9 beta-reductase